MNPEQLINDVLHNTCDDMLSLNAQQLGLQTRLTLDGDQLGIQLTAGFPSKSLASTLLPKLKQNLTTALPAYQIKLHLNHFIRAHRTQLPGKGLRGVKNTIAVASGKGGVGKSTVAVNLATALAQAGARVGILDADIYGPSIPLMLGKTEPVAVKDNHYLPVLAHGVQAMSIGYLTDSEQALIWRGPMLAKSLIQMLDLTCWDELDYLFIDLPPGTGDIQLSLVQKIPLTGAVVVTTPQHIATLDAQKAMTMFARTNIDVLGLVENMSLHHCSHCGHEEAIFGEGGGQKLSDSFNAHFLGQLPLDSQIGNQSDEGRPTAVSGSDYLAKSFLQIALRTAIILAGKPVNYADKFPNVVVE